MRAGHVDKLIDDIAHGRFRTTDEIKAGKRSAGPATTVRIVSTLRSALNTAVKRRLIPYNPVNHVEFPEVHQPKVHPWEPEELGAFVDAARGDRLGLMYEVMAYTGLRRGEACGLRWQDVDLANGVIDVVQQMTSFGGQRQMGPPKTAAGVRKVNLPKETTGALLAHQVTQEIEKSDWGSGYADSGLVFCREDGSPLRPDYVSRHMQLIARGAGLRSVRLHELRHGTASLQLAAGVPLAIVSKLMGHSRTSLTADTCFHLLKGVGAEAAEKSAAMVSRRPKTVDISDVAVEIPAG